MLEYHLASKPTAAAREAFSYASPDCEVLNQTTIHRLVTNIR
jgi:hypothetical protein